MYIRHILEEQEIVTELIVISPSVSQVDSQRGNTAYDGSE